MALRVYRHESDIFLTGAGATGCLRWHRGDDGWRCTPAALPEGAETIGPDAVPEDLREELLAFATRAEAMGQGGIGDPAAPQRN